jgi:hypothetical protein
MTNQPIRATTVTHVIQTSFLFILDLLFATYRRDHPAQHCTRNSLAVFSPSSLPSPNHSSRRVLSPHTILTRWHPTSFLHLPPTTTTSVPSNSLRCLAPAAPPDTRTPILTLARSSTGSHIHSHNMPHAFTRSDHPRTSQGCSDRTRHEHECYCVYRARGYLLYHDGCLHRCNVLYTCACLESLPMGYSYRAYGTSAQCGSRAGFGSGTCPASQVMML